MDGAPDSFVFFQVPSYLAAQAFAFHQSQSGNEHIWPRTKEQIRTYAEEGELFGVRRASSGEFVALCYSTFDGNEWEVGGLTTSNAARGLHLATFLVRFALAHTIAWNSPWKGGKEIIAHVHDENPAPRRLLLLLGFEFAKKVEVPGDKAPLSMKRNAAGNLSGDQFRFPPSAVEGLLNWFEHEFKGTLDDGKNLASFEIAGGLGALVEALREAVAGVKS
jgi:RimJ/RimL family protein N-acetyltransferase